MGNSVIQMIFMPLIFQTQTVDINLDCVEVPCDVRNSLFFKFENIFTEGRTKESQTIVSFLTKHEFAKHE
jgi:hypothetical protein